MCPLLRGCFKATDKTPHSILTMSQACARVLSTSPTHPRLLEGLLGSRCVRRPHLARRRELINAGEERHHGGDGDTCHHRGTSWSVTDKYSPWDMNLLPVSPTELGWTKGKTELEHAQKSIQHALKSKVDMSSYIWSLKVRVMCMEGVQEQRISLNSFNPVSETLKVPSSDLIEGPIRVPLCTGEQEFTRTM